MTTSNSPNNAPHLLFCDLADDLPLCKDPFELFNKWMTLAKSSEINDADAACLATIGGDGQVHARMILLRGWDESGFWFNTNAHSGKGQDIAKNANVALCVHWKSLLRQVRIEGKAHIIPSQESDAYFATRARTSQIAAWASEQSSPLDSRKTLEKRLQALEAKYAGTQVPRPAHWQGYRVVPQTIEFWQQRDFRLHDRFIFTRLADGGWNIQRLNP